MPPESDRSKKCKICGGKGWFGQRGIGRRSTDAPKTSKHYRGKQGRWVRVPCVCKRGKIGRPPLSLAILEAFADAGSFEVLDEMRELSTAPPVAPTRKRESA